MFFDIIDMLAIRRNSLMKRYDRSSMRALSRDTVGV
jgi:hypothetical protein